MIMLDYSDSLNVPVTVMMMESLFISEYCVNTMYSNLVRHKSKCEKTITVHYITYF